MAMYILNDVAGISYPTHRYYYLYRTHGQILHRCYDTGHISYKDYGGRGISIDPIWRADMKGFALWILNNLGERPANLTLDRIDNDKGYQPGNLRWATKSMQTNNRRLLPTNTGHSGISFTNRNNRRWYKVSVNSKYVGSCKTLKEAIAMRDGHVNS